MKNVYTAENIFFVGDTHGQFGSINEYIKVFEITNSIFIVVGDCGIGFKENKNKEFRWFKYLNDSYKSKNNIIICIRGNHDNPAYFNGSIDYSHFKLISDYTVFEINGIKMIGIGGAVSIDRLPNRQMNHSGRTVNHDYWIDGDSCL